MSVALKGNDPRQRRNPQAGTRGEDYKPPLYVENAAGTNGRALRRLELRTGSDFVVDGSGQLGLSSSVRIKNLVTITTDYTVRDDDEVIIRADSASNVIVTLPLAGASVGRVLTFKHATVLAVTTTIQSPGAVQTIDNNSSLVLPTAGGSALDAAAIISDGTEWWII
jgi:hypothetical protein